MFTQEALESPKGQDFIRYWMAGMTAAQALDKAFGKGATEEMARRVWVEVNCRSVFRKAGL